MKKLAGLAAVVVGDDIDAGLDVDFDSVSGRVVASVVLLPLSLASAAAAVVVAAAATVVAAAADAVASSVDC